MSQLTAFKDLDTEQLTKIAQDVVVSNAGKGTRLLEKGSTDTSTIYLLEGCLRLTAADGSVMYVNHTDPSANDPVARLRPAHYDVTAATPVSFLRVDTELLNRVDKAVRDLALLGYEVLEEASQEEMELEFQLTADIEADLEQEKLFLPSLPEIAIRVGEAVSDENATAGTVAKAIEADPAIATKLLRTANSARFAGRAATKSLEDAVVRLGLNTTHKLVVALTLRELFRTRNTTLRNHMKKLWEHSRLVAALSQVLAKRAGKFDPDFALLAGLAHDIGEIAIVAYIEPLIDENPPAGELEAIAQRLRGPIGEKLLTYWKLPEPLPDVARHAEDWQRSTTTPADYIDLVQVAQYHAFVDTQRRDRAPEAEQISAFRRLGLETWGHDAAVELLVHARNEIQETEQLLG